MKKRIIKNAADATSGYAAGEVLGVLMSIGTPAAVALTGPALGGVIALLAAAITLWSGLEDPDDSKAVERELRRLHTETGDLSKAVNSLELSAIEGDLDRERLLKGVETVRRMIATQEADQRRVAEESEALLVYVGRTLDHRLDSVSAEHQALRELLEQQHQAFKRQIEDVVKKVDSLEDLVVSSKDEIIAAVDQKVPILVEYDRRLDNVDALIKEHQYQRAVGLLDDLLESDRSTKCLSDNQRRRSLALRGLIERVIGRGPVAGRFFVRAADAMSTHEEAHAFRSIGHGLLNDETKAREQADLAVRKHPGIARSWTAWIYSRPDSLPLADLETSLPADVLHDGDVLYALAVRAQMACDLDRAVSLHRRNVDQEMRPHIAFQLGVSLIRRQRQRLEDCADDELLEGEASDLREAIDLLVRARKQAVVKEVEQAPYHLLVGSAWQMLGNDEAAQKEYFLGHIADPSAAQAVAALAELNFLQGRTGDAIAQLREVTGEGGADVQTGMLVRILLDRRGCGDAEEAAKLAENAVSKLTLEHSPVFRYQLVLNLLDALLQVGCPEAAMEKLPDVEHLLSKALGKAVHARTLCMIEHKLTESDEPDNEESQLPWSPAVPIPAAARTMAEEAVETLKSEHAAVSPDNRGGFDPLAVASQLYAMRQYDLALDVYREHVAIPDAPGASVSDRVMNMLHAAERAGEVRFVLDACRTARPTMDRRLVLLECDLLRQWGSGQQALQVVDDYLAQSPDPSDAAFVRHKRSGIGLDAGLEELFEAEVVRLPKASEVEATVGAEVVRNLLRRGRLEDAADYANTLYQRFPDSAEIAEELVRAAHPVLSAISAGREGEAGNPLLEKLPEVTNSCGICLEGREPGALHATRRWVVISNTSPPLPDETPAASDRAKQLIGRRAGDEVTDRGPGPLYEEPSKILFIFPQIVGRAALVGAEFRRRFPEATPPYQEFQAPLKANGEIDPEGVRAQFLSVTRDPAWDAAEAARTEAVSQMLRDKWPIATIAMVLARPIVEVVDLLHMSASARLRTSTGTREEHADAQAALEQRTSLVIEPTAAAVLFLSGIWREDAAAALTPSHKVAMSPATLWSLRRTLQRLRCGEHVSLGQSMILYRKDDATPLHATTIADHLEEYISWLEATVEVVDGLGLLDLSPRERHELLAVFGRGSAEAMMLARTETHALWCDDLGSAERAKAFGIKSACSQDVLAFGRQRWSDAQHQLAEWQCVGRATFCRMTPSLFTRVAAAVDHDPNHSRLRKLVQTMFDTDVEDAGFIRLAIVGMMTAARASGGPLRKQSLMDAVLDQLRLHHGGELIAEAVNRHAIDLFQRDGNSRLWMNLLYDRWLIGRDNYPGDPIRL